MKKAVLLVNLGSPDSTDIKDVKKYLDEFLMDKYVIDFPYILRALLVRGIILQTRPRNSAQAYKSIWQPEGSPLVIYSKKIQENIKHNIPVPVGLAMRYGSISIHSEIKKLTNAHPQLEEIFLIPLYPHYAMSSFQTVEEKTKEILKKHFPNIKLSIQSPFYNEEKYLNALANSIRPYMKENFDHFLFSYHGIPIRHLKKTDPTKKHCQQINNCCVTKSEAHKTCYKHQITMTTLEVSKLLGLKKNQFSITFQSRLKGDNWLQPYTDYAFKEMPKRNIKRLAVICPAFVSDCLETLEEITMRGKKDFMANGGEYFKQIPCLNDNKEWINVLNHYVNKNFLKSV